MSSAQIEDQRLLSIIHEIFLRHERRYGARRIVEELEAQHELCGVPRVARLMKTLGLIAIQPKRFRPRTTDSRHNLGYSPNLLLNATAPIECNQVWIGDITYIGLKGEIFDYLALLVDLFSRKIIGWAMQDNLEASLVTRRELDQHDTYLSERNICQDCRDASHDRHPGDLRSATQLDPAGGLCVSCRCCHGVHERLSVC